MHGGKKMHLEIKKKYINMHGGKKMHLEIKKKYKYARGKKDAQFCPCSSFIPMYEFGMSTRWTAAERNVQ